LEKDIVLESEGLPKSKVQDLRKKIQEIQDQLPKAIPDEDSDYSDEEIEENKEEKTSKKYDIKHSNDSDKEIEENKEEEPPKKYRVEDSDDSEEEIKENKKKTSKNDPFDYSDDSDDNF
jgi:predicted  nucleic acid-binding Zn-ribbon protein